MKPVTFLVVLGLLFCAADVHALDLNMTKEEKSLTANVGTGLFITTWGVLFWDYGKHSPRWGGERWFQKDTSEGGADKLAHLYANYAITHGFSYLYEKWGYDHEKASLYGALSALGWMSFMEIGDSFSDFGFSYEDMVMNVVGSGLGYLIYRYPEVARKIDVRIEYSPNFKESDIFTDYGHMKFLVAAKLDGFDSITNKYLKYMDIQLGYYTRGFSEENGIKTRNIYVGVGINLSKIFNQLAYPKLASFFNYYQAPFTYVSHRRELK